MLIPSQNVFRLYFTIDLGNSNVTSLNNNTVFESAWWNGENLESNFGLPDDSHMGFGMVLKNFNIDSPDLNSLITNPALRIQDWHQGSVIENINSSYYDNFLDSSNNYYTIFKNIKTLTPVVGTKARYIFRGSHNLCYMEMCLGANSPVGYLFEGPVTAFTMKSMSFEGMAIGAHFKSAVYDISITDSYMEAVDDVVLKFDSYVNVCKLSNNYINYATKPNMCLVEYTPLPANNIIVDSSNYFESILSTNKIFKNLDNTVGYNRYRIDEPMDSIQGTNDLDKLLVNNSLYSTQADYNKKVISSNFKANVNNEFAIGNYSGRFSNGFNSLVGGRVSTYGVNVIDIETKITRSDTSFIYVNIRLTVNDTSYSYIKGFFIGSLFINIDDSGLTPSTKVNIAEEGGFMVIRNQTLGEPITNCVGEIRLI